MMPLFTAKEEQQIINHYRQAICSLDPYCLEDILGSLIARRGGIRHVQSAMEQAIREHRENRGQGEK